MQAVIANSIGESAIAKGAKCYIVDMPGDPLCVQITCRSRGGRIIRKWTSTVKLENARVVNLPEQFGRETLGIGYYHSRTAERTAQIINTTPWIKRKETDDA